jgi:hypothetical protein
MSKALISYQPTRQQWITDDAGNFWIAILLQKILAALRIDCLVPPEGRIPFSPLATESSSDI